MSAPRKSDVYPVTVTCPPRKIAVTAWAVSSGSWSQNPSCFVTRNRRRTRLTGHKHQPARLLYPAVLKTMKVHMSNTTCGPSTLMHVYNVVQHFFLYMHDCKRDSFDDFVYDYNSNILFTCSSSCCWRACVGPMTQSLQLKYWKMVNEFKG